MFGRRWSDGLHQAVEAKEGVQIQNESITYATITLQNYFRLYDKLAGMTGTAATEAEEFFKIYKLEVVVIPTHRPMVREDDTDLVYRTERAKFEAVAEEIEELQREGPPGARRHRLDREVGVPLRPAAAQGHPAPGAERQAAREGSRHRRPGGPLRRRHHRHQHGRPWHRHRPRRQARRPRRRTSGRRSTTASSRPAASHIIGTERHESRRIDNQLRGRSGRQGDPGTLALLRLVRGRHHAPLRAGLAARHDGEARHGRRHAASRAAWSARAIETAQTKVEGHNFDIRKHVVDYDDVMNTQRDVIYKERRKILEGADLKTNILDMVREELTAIVDANTPGDDADELGPRGAARRGERRSSSCPDEFTPEALATMTPGRHPRGGPRSSPTTPTRTRKRRSAPRRHARARAPRDAALDRLALGRAPDRDGRDAPGHRPAGVRPDRTRSSPTSAKRTTCGSSSSANIRNQITRVHLPRRDAAPPQAAAARPSSPSRRSPASPKTTNGAAATGTNGPQPDSDGRARRSAPSRRRWA